MYCSKCGESLEEIVGTKLTDCYHCLCLKCLEKAVEQTRIPGVRCDIVRGGFSRCQGYLSHEELEFMVSEEIYGEYIERVTNNAAGSDEEEDDDGYEDAYNFGSTSAIPRPVSPEYLPLTEEDKQYGWAHKILLVDDLIQRQGFSSEEAESHVEKMAVLETKAIISCSICMDDEVPSGDGVVLKDCFHMFCKACLANLVEHNDEPIVKCPYIDGNYSCVYQLQQREIRGLVTDAIYDKYLEKSLKLGESSMENSFHCKTPDCPGWCVYDPDVIRFDCPLCKKTNCIKCQAIHSDSCEDYKNRIVQNANDKLSEDALEDLVRKGEYMRCPKCRIPVQKVVGCDWLQCTCCKTEICWVTRGPRWGPNGRGDSSGGCRCRINGIPCHPQCRNCH